MADYGMEAVAMEVSSHGLAMGRTDSVDFDIAVFTNLTYDHLDYHKTMDQYFEAKKRLFTQMKPAGTAVLNADDISFEELKKAPPAGLSPMVWCMMQITEQKMCLFVNGSAFTLVYGGKRYKVETNLSAKYNLYNLLGAIAAMHEAGMEIEDMLAETFPDFSDRRKNGNYRQGAGFYGNRRLCSYAGWF